MKDEKSAPFVVRVLHAPKEGSNEDQYEDACAFAPRGENGDALTVALSDGASAAVFARDWANLLVQDFATGAPFPDSDADVHARVAALAPLWRANVEDRATSWWAQEKLPSGSAATLLVVDFDAAAMRWQARAVGDVCLFVVRAEKLKYAFPITKSARFDDRPGLLTTVLSHTPPKIARFGAELMPNDRFFLMTDALAAYFLQEFEAKHKPWNDLPVTNPVLADFIKPRRDKGVLKNDDVTLVEITLTAA